MDSVHNYFQIAQHKAQAEHTWGTCRIKNPLFRASLHFLAPTSPHQCVMLREDQSGLLKITGSGSICSTRPWSQRSAACVGFLLICCIKRRRQKCVLPWTKRETVHKYLSSSVPLLCSFRLHKVTSELTHIRTLKCTENCNVTIPGRQSDVTQHLVREIKHATIKTNT